MKISKLQCSIISSRGSKVQLYTQSGEWRPLKTRFIAAGTTDFFPISPTLLKSTEKVDFNVTYCLPCLHVGDKSNLHSTKKHSTKKPVTTMLTYPWKCTVLHCNHLGNTWKPLVLMTQHFDHCPSASEGDNQSVRSSASVVVDVHLYQWFTCLGVNKK